MVSKTCISASLRLRHYQRVATQYEQLILHVFSVALKAFRTLIRIIKPILWYLKQLICCAVDVVGFVCSFLFTIITNAIMDNELSLWSWIEVYMHMYICIYMPDVSMQQRWRHIRPNVVLIERSEINNSLSE